MESTKKKIQEIENKVNVYGNINNSGIVIGKEQVKALAMIAEQMRIANLLEAYKLNLVPADKENLISGLDPSN